MRTTAFAWLIASAFACRAAPAPAPPSVPSDLSATIEALYAAFDFDPGAEPDWRAQRRVYLEGAIFVPPIRPGRAPETDGVEAFLADFREYARSDPYATTGFHERIVGLRADAFGGVAHAFVAFEGYGPGDGATQTRGVDSIQFVHDGAAWRLVSFTTQYEGDELELPARFLR